MKRAIQVYQAEDAPTVTDLSRLHATWLLPIGIEDEEAEAAVPTLESLPSKGRRIDAVAFGCHAVGESMSLSPSPSDLWKLRFGYDSYSKFPIAYRAETVKRAVSGQSGIRANQKLTPDLLAALMSYNGQMWRFSEVPIKNVSVAEFADLRLLTHRIKWEKLFSGYSHPLGPWSSTLRAAARLLGYTAVTKILSGKYLPAYVRLSLMRDRNSTP